MIKWCFYISIFVLSTVGFSQQETKKETWKTEKELLKYEQKENYNGPEDWHGAQPSNLKSPYRTQGGKLGSSRNRNIRLNPQSIKRDRQRRYQGYDRGGGGGTVKHERAIKRPTPPKPPEIDAPDYDPPKVDPIDLSGSFWKILLYVLIIAMVLVLVYLIVKNSSGSSNKKVAQPIVENDWNPEVISKTELELKLEEAMKSGDYRECVRIYFTFILKELIRKRWILWKREKTNHHYVMEMGGKPGSNSFYECVRIYDLVWYGEYDINQDIFEVLQPTLKNYYQSLESSDEQ